MDANLNNLVGSRLVGIVSDALKLGITYINDGNSFSPFAVMDGNGKRTITIFPTEDRRKAVGEARTVAATVGDGIDLFVIGYDGVITLDGETNDAIVVEGREAGSDQAFLFVQCYLERPLHGRSELAGKAMCLGPISLDRFYGKVEEN